jgi:putative oxidoreductase
MTNVLTARFFGTRPDNTALAIQRLVLALVIVPHGAQKLLGWFGGFGFSGTIGYFTETMHFPWALALLVVLAESLGPVLLVAGVGTRLAALGISAVMVGAILTTHWKVGFFMNWFGAQKGEGFEFHLLALALSVPLLVWGGGRSSADTVIARSLKRWAGQSRNASMTWRTMR